MSGNSEQMPSPEIKVDREVVLTINHQEFRIRKGERFVVGEGKLVIKPAEGDEVNEEDSVDQDSKTDLMK